MYSGFLRRVAAFTVDTIIYLLLCSFVDFLLSLVGSGVGGVAWLVTLGLFVFYYIYLESSPWQATVGKKLFHIKVTDLNGERISFWRSLSRRLCVFLSVFIFGFGFLMCIFTKKKQCLHDKMTGCLVVSKEGFPSDQTAKTMPNSVWVLLTLLLLLLYIAKESATAANQYQETMNKVEIGQANIMLKHMQKAGFEYFRAKAVFPENDLQQLPLELPHLSADGTEASDKYFTYKAEGKTYYIVSAEYKGNYPLVLSRIILPSGKNYEFCGEESVQVRMNKIAPPKKPTGNAAKICESLFPQSINRPSQGQASSPNAVPQATKQISKRKLIENAKNAKIYLNLAVHAQQRYFLRYNKYANKWKDMDIQVGTSFQDEFLCTSGSYVPPNPATIQKTRTPAIFGYCTDPNGYLMILSTDTSVGSIFSYPQHAPFQPMEYVFGRIPATENTDEEIMCLYSTEQGKEVCLGITSHIQKTNFDR